MPGRTAEATPPAPNPVAAAILAARSGREGDAAAMLAKLIKEERRDDKPIGFIVTALRQGGSPALADWLLDTALAHGHDVTALQPGLDDVLARTDPATARVFCRRYEHAFAAGKANALMVGRYAVALSRAGEWETLARLYPAGRTIRQVQLDTLDGFESLSAFNDTIIADIREGAPEELLDGRNYMHATKRYHRVHKVERPAIARLMDVAGRAFDDYVATFAPEADHPLAVMRPPVRRIVAWANIYDAGSFVLPHLHHHGWLVAVYYPRVPAVTAGPAEAGALKVARPDHLGGLAPPAGVTAWPEATISPQPGMLVIMPSYCFHFSVPFQGEGERVAVTIDQNIDQQAGKTPFVPPSGA